MTVTAIIPARSGSKAIPNKNMSMFRNKPLVGWTIEESFKSVDITVVTTDSMTIGQYAADLTAHVVKRPESLAQDHVHAIEPVIHAMNWCELPDDETVVMLLPTSPLRTAQDIRNALRLHKQYDKNVVSLCETSPLQSMRYMNGIEIIYPNIGEVRARNAQRQSVEKTYVVNGAIFVSKAGLLRKFRTFHIDSVLGYVMPKYRSIDVNDYEDLTVANKLYELEREQLV